MAKVLQVEPALVAGNCALVDVREVDGAWEVEFMAEPRRSPEPLWFHFSCELTERTHLRFEWVNADGCLGLGSAEALERVRPVVWLDDGPWRRVEGVAVEPRGAAGHALVFAAPQPCDSAHVAFCYPYGPENLRSTLRHSDGPWQNECIGLSGESRLLRRLRAPAAQGSPGAYVIARQHAGETPGSWVLDGLLRAVADGEDRGLRQVEWWVVPFVDLDGVLNGDYGKDAMPQDFNRSWGAMPMRPEVLAVQNDAVRFAAHSDVRLFLDLHAPGGAERAVYQMLPRQERPRAQREAAMSFSPYLADEFPDLPPHELARVPAYPSRWNVDDLAANWFWEHLDHTPGWTVETSCQGLEGRDFEPQDYRDVGRRLARAAAAWLLQRAGG